MLTKFGRILAVTSLIIVLTLLLSSPLAAQPADRQPSPPASAAPRAVPLQQPYAEESSASDAALQRLSPNLREAPQAQADSEHLVFVLIEPGARVESFLTKAVTSRRFGELQWVTGLVDAGSLLKLAGAEGVLSVTSGEGFRPATAPGLEELTNQPPAMTRERIAELPAEGGREAALSAAYETDPVGPTIAAQPAAEAPTTIDTIKATDIHRAAEANAAGYTGTGVVAAVIDTGVDFAATDLRGTQARVAGGTYDGWPYAYDTLSGAYYALESATIGPDNYWS